MRPWRKLMIVAALVAATSAVPAEAVAQRAGDGSTGIATRVTRADAAYSAGDRQSAEREYAAIVALDSGRSHAVFRLAQLRAAHDRAGAIALYRRYVTLEPRDAWGYVALADVLGASGDMSGALAAYANAARLGPGERDVRVGRARLLARAGYTDAAIAEYEQWVAHATRDAEAWRELAAQRRRAGRYPEAVAALEHVDAPDAGTRAAVAREIARLRTLSGATVEPLIGGSHDSDGLTTVRAGATVTGPAMGRARAFASASADRAGDGTFARGSQKTSVGIQYRPLAQLRLELVGGIARADRTFVDTATTPTTPTTPIGGGSGRGPQIGRPAAGGASTFETFPVGRARLVWRNPGDAIGVDARVTRQLLDASPFLVAQGAVRDEASLALDARLTGPIRVRGFGRIGTVHNEDETNGRQIVGGALAYAPGSYEVTLRAQTMRYDAPTALAYFAPRHVHTAEITTYVERETADGTTVSLDLGGGAQQVVDWTTTPGRWSPSFHGWTQVVRPLGGRFALGTELEAYDARVGTDAPSVTMPTAQWWYGSLALWLRAAF
jgi:cytochrome c-type biogenesis protein CcmH/NrfG